MVMKQYWVPYPFFQQCSTLEEQTSWETIERSHQLNMETLAKRSPYKTQPDSKQKNEPKYHLPNSLIPATKTAAHTSFDTDYHVSSKTIPCTAESQKMRRFLDHRDGSLFSTFPRNNSFYTASQDPIPFGNDTRYQSLIEDDEGNDHRQSQSRNQYNPLQGNVHSRDFMDYQHNFHRYSFLEDAGGRSQSIDRMRHNDRAHSLHRLSHRLSISSPHLLVDLDQQISPAVVVVAAESPRRLSQDAPVPHPMWDTPAELRTSMNFRLL